MKNRASASTLKKVAVQMLDGSVGKGYLNPGVLGRAETVDLLTPNGEHQPVQLADVKSVYFIREFTEPFEPERKAFLSRPKLSGLWVKLRFRDDDTIEGIVSNDLLDLLDAGVHLTPPDLHGNNLRMYIPRSALKEMIVLGVVGALGRPSRGKAKGTAEPMPAQPGLFNE